MKLNKTIKTTVLIFGISLSVLTMSSCVTSKIVKAIFPNPFEFEDEDEEAERIRIQKIIETGKRLDEKVDEIQKAAKTEFSPEEEYFIGRSVAASILSLYPVIEDQEVTNYINKILHTLVINNEIRSIYNDYHAIILDSDEMNAFATPGGHIMITKGLIKNAGTEDALAAIIAHELAHIQKSHGTNAIVADRIKNATKNLGLTALDEYNEIIRSQEEYEDDFLGLSEIKEKARQKLQAAFSGFINNSIDTLVNSGYSQATEFEADDTALCIMANAGYNVYGMKDMLDMLSIVTVKGSTGFGKTHPAPKLRIKNLNKKYSLYPSYSTDEARTERYLTITSSL